MGLLSKLLGSSKTASSSKREPKVMATFMLKNSKNWSKERVVELTPGLSYEVARGDPDNAFHIKQQVSGKSVFYFLHGPGPIIGRVSREHLKFYLIKSGDALEIGIQDHSSNGSLVQAQGKKIMLKKKGTAVQLKKGEKIEIFLPQKAYFCWITIELV